MNTQLKERPIILSAEEVHAVLAGDKTQHRVIFDFAIMQDHNCPFGKVGDQLWVQEEHRPVNWSFDDGEVTIEYRDGTTKTPHYLTDEEFETNPNDDYPFAVVDELLDRNIPIMKGKDCFDFSNPDNLPHWRTADVMPRFASRLLLEITDIRIERVQDTSHADAVAEGVSSFDIEARLRDQALSVAQIVFSRHWDTKNQEHHVMWEDNPWVWVIEFKKVSD